MREIYAPPPEVQRKPFCLLSGVHADQLSSQKYAKKFGASGVIVANLKVHLCMVGLHSMPQRSCIFGRKGSERSANPTVQLPQKSR